LKNIRRFALIVALASKTCWKSRTLIATVPITNRKSFTIITRAANAAIAPLHDRMPVIIAPSHFVWWLKEDDPRSESHKMALERAPDDPLKIYPVSELVNSPNLDDPRCIELVRIDRDFFERHWWGGMGNSKILEFESIAAAETI
jgi:putative SOS response-associated peptidase YedK